MLSGDSGARAAPTFTIDQRRELIDSLHLHAEQVNQLESYALPLIRVFIRKEPPTNDVRDQLTETLRRLDTARQAIEQLLHSPMGYSALTGEVHPSVPALTRVLVAS